MIFISSTSSKKRKLREAIVELAQEGFKNIELTGGTEYEPQYLDILLELKNKYLLNFRVHNYFPIPEKPFVLNLASNNDKVIKASRKMILEAFKLSEQLGANKYGVHAGFRINPAVDELGKKIGKSELTDVNVARAQFFEHVHELKLEGEKHNVQLYIENNVFSATNFESFKNENPFLLTNFQEYISYQGKLEASLLLDVAHLKVSAQTLNLNFEDEMRHFLEVCDYLHLSDNDGKSDSNHSLKNDTLIVNLLKEYGVKNKTVTLEVYEDLKRVHESYDLIQNLMA